MRRFWRGIGGARRGIFLRRRGVEEVVDGGDGLGGGLGGGWLCREMCRRVGGR